MSEYRGPGRNLALAWRTLPRTVFRADNPLFSDLRLDDGPMTVHDVGRLRRAPFRLILPSCEAPARPARRGRAARSGQRSPPRCATPAPTSAGTAPATRPRRRPGPSSPTARDQKAYGAVR